MERKRRKVIRLHTKNEGKHGFHITQMICTYKYVFMIFGFIFQGLLYS